MALSHLIHRRIPLKPTFLYLSHLFPPKPMSQNLCSIPQIDEQPPPPTNPPNPTSLSARMSFVFDQIDAIEKERSQKDETLQRIRAWRESKTKKYTNNNDNDDATNAIANVNVNPSGSSSSSTSVGGDFGSAVSGENGGGLMMMRKGVELVHPWPEWIELMERLVRQNYFDHRRKDEERMVEDLGFQMEEVIEEGVDFTRDWKTVQTACLNFGKDRFDILRSLSRQDIQVLVGYGCPSADKKVVFSAKLLRKHVHLDEGDVCSSCSLRSTCERGYLLTNKEDEARTIDIMRVLLTYGFDPVNGSVVNEPLLKIKSVKTVVRKLLHQVVNLSAVPIDPNLPPPIIKKPPPKVKQSPPTPRRRVGRDDIEMKRGDWLCPKCDFMNFAKNSVCLQCDGNRPKRQLLPGEWECPECNFLNYRRNVVCFHCECKRPADEYMENKMQERQRSSRTMPEKITSRKDSWNFDFDDNESDGADVAAFEYADSHKLDEDFPNSGRPEGENNRTSDEGFHRDQRLQMEHERETSDLRPRQPGTGFDDFDDEEDDLDSYELDTQTGDQPQKAATIDYSELEVDSDGDDTEGDDVNCRSPRGSPPRNLIASKPRSRKAAFSGSDDELDFDSDEEVSSNRNWKSSHVADSRQRIRGRKPISYGSDEDIGPSSGSEDEDNFRSRHNKGNKWGNNRKDFGRRSSRNSEEFSGSESDGENLRSHRNKGGKPNFDSRRNVSMGRGRAGFSENTGFKSGGMMRDRKISSKDKLDRSAHGPRGHDRGFCEDDNGGRIKTPSNDRLDRSAHGPRGHDRGFREDDYGGRRKGAGGGRSRNFGSPKRENFGNRERGRGSKFDNQSTGDSYFDDERHRRPRENVR